MTYADRAQYAKRGLAAYRWPYHKYNCQYRKRETYQHETLTKICKALNCGILDIIELTQDKNSNDESKR